MDDNSRHGYIELGKGNVGTDLRFTRTLNHISPPVDKYNAIYLSLVLAGVGFLLPYNSFTIAVDYFQSRYPETTIIFDMSLTYILMSFFAVLVNNLLVEVLTLRTRINTGYCISIVTLIFVASCEIWFNLFGRDISYYVNLLAVGTVAIGCTVLQSSFYGYTSMLPSRYTQAVMAGESGAGFIVSINRIMTKLMSSDARLNTFVFFSISCVSIVVCHQIHRVVQRTDFVQFYITLCKETRKIVLEPADDIVLMEALEEKDSLTEVEGQFGHLRLSSENDLDTKLQEDDNIMSFANPVYDPSAGTSTTTYKVEDVIVKFQATGSGGSFNSSKFWSAIRRGRSIRWSVIKNIWQYMVSICMAYFVTLSLYPGIISEIKSCKEDTWFPILLMTLFNASDLVGKMLASIRYEWLQSQLFIFACWRICLIPFLVLCTSPRGKPLMAGEGYPMFFVTLLGITNGIVGSVPMIQAPRKVTEQHRELAGNLMTMSYNVGLTAGALAAYGFEKILGAPNARPCNAFSTYETGNVLLHLTTNSSSDIKHALISSTTMYFIKS